MEEEPTEIAPALAKLKATLDTEEFRKAIKDARIEQPEEFRQQCLKFCEDLYEWAASEWLEYYEAEENNFRPRFEGADLLEHYPALQSCWLGDVQAAITNAAESEDADQSDRDFYYFMLGISCSAWSEHGRRRRAATRPG